MKTRTYNSSQIIFKQNDIADGVFDISEGKVGIYVDYKTDQEKLIQELGKGEIFGELGLIGGFPRTATAVALEDGTVLNETNVETFSDYFIEDSEKTLKLLKVMSRRIRETNEKYLDVCRVVYLSHEAEKNNKKRDEKVNQELDMICREYGRFNTLWLD